MNEIERFFKEIFGVTVDEARNSRMKFTAIDICRFANKYHESKAENLPISGVVRSADEIEKASDIIHNNKSLTYSYREDIINVLDWVLGGDEFYGLDGK